MPYTESDGLNIYYEVEGNGPPVVLAHGLSMSLEDWRDLGYVESLKDEFMVILVDARGHGRSDKPHDPAAYSRHHLASDHIAVLDDLHLPQAHFVGYSMGASTCLSVGIHASERCLTLVLAGSQPFAQDEISPDIPPHLTKALNGLPTVEDPIRNLLTQGGDAWLAFFKSNMNISSGMAVRLRQNDFKALLAYHESPKERGVGRHLNLLDIPCLVLVGEDETVYRGALELARRLEHTELFSFPDFNHFDIIAESNVTLPIIRRFLVDYSHGA